MIKENNMQVPKLRFKEFNDEWNLNKLKDFSNRVTRKNKDNLSKLPLTISAQDGLVDQISFFNKTVASKDLSGYYLLYNGDFAYNKSYSNGYPWGTIKRLDKYDMGVLSTLYICFKPNSTINSNFLVQLFNSTVWYSGISEIAVEGARNHGLLNISVSDFFETIYKIPSLEEQTKIANFLSLIDRKIELQEKLVENLKLYKKGLLKKVFSNNLGWKTQKLGDICDTITKGTTPFNFESSGVNFIRVECINNFEIDIKKCLYISNKTHINDLKRSILKENDLLFAIAGSIGKCGIVKKEYLPCNTNQALAIIRLKKNQNPYYILLIINSSKMKKYIYENISIGAQPNLNLEQIGNFEIPIPPIEEQNKIANLFTSLDKKIELETKKLQDLKTYKKGLLQKMFI